MDDRVEMGAKSRYGRSRGNSLYTLQVVYLESILEFIGEYYSLRLEITLIFMVGYVCNFIYCSNTTYII